LDLPVRDPAAVDRLQAVVAELDRRLALRLAGAPAAVHLAELGLLRHEHGSALLRALGRRRGSLGRLRGRSLVRLRLRRLLLVAARAASARGARALPRPAALAGTAAAASATGAAPALAHRPEALTVGSAAASALAGGAEALDRSAAAAARVLVAETRVAGRDALVALGHDLALVDPDLHPDAAVRRLRLDEAVVDVRADGVERDASLAVGLAPAHLAAAETAGALDLHAGGAGADRGRERALHRAPERDAVGELLGNRLRDELRVQLRAQRVDLDAGLADDDAGARRVDVHRDALLVLLDEDVRQTRVRELLVDVLADLHVLEQVVGELLLARVPVRLPA